MEAVISFISTVGFPIAVAVALGWFIFQIYKRSEQREDELRAEIKENQTINAKFAEIIAAHAAELGEIKSDIREIKNTLEISA